MIRRSVAIPVLCVSLCLILSSCENNQNSATIYIRDGEYNWTPTDLVQALNSEIDATGDSRYLQIPEYKASGEKILIDNSHLTLTLDESDRGFLTQIVVDWGTFMETKERINTCGLIIGRLIGSISPSDTDNVYDKLDINASGSHEYTTTAESNGTRYTYRYTLNGMYQSLTITPISAHDVPVTISDSIPETGEETGFDLDGLSNQLSQSFEETFGYPGYETSWYRYVSAIRAVRDDSQYSISVVLNTDDAEVAQDIGTITFGYYCKNGFNGTALHATYVYNSNYKLLFSRSA